MKKGLSKLLLTGFILLSLTLFLAGCTSKDSSSTTGLTAAASVTTPVTLQQKSFLNSYPHLTVDWNSAENVPYSLRGFDKKVAGDTAAAALDFLDEIKPIFKMKDPASELSLRMIQDDDLGYKHTRFYQKYNGLSVVGGELIVHINKDNKIYQVNGQYYPEINITITPEISADAALVAGLDELQGKPGFNIEKAPVLVVYPAGLSQYILAYHYILSYDNRNGDVGQWYYYVNASTGDVLKQYDNIKSFKAPDNISSGARKGSLRKAATTSAPGLLTPDIMSIAAPTGSGSNQNMTGSILAGEGGGSVSVPGWADTTNAADYLYNKTRYWYVFNYSTTGTYNLDYNTYAYRDGTTHAWGTTDRVEMSAAQNINIVQNYFWSVHSRNSFNNAGAYAVVNVHYGTNLVNAYWNGSEFLVGDADGVDANPLAVLDVVGHEFGHAWTQYTSDLTYAYESGGLNESFSDIIGANVEFYAQTDNSSSYPSRTAGTADWLMGEDCWLSSTALRDMRNPSNTATVGSGGEQPSKYHGSYWKFGTADNGGVHYNGGPQSFAYYLLSVGGTGYNDGLYYNVTGIDTTPTNNTKLIAYRANSNYMTSSTDYSTARAAWISAATDLQGANDWVTPVNAAWLGVGVTSFALPVNESFESASLPSGWTTGGDASWAPSTTVTARDGSRSLKAGTITHSQSTWLQRTITASAAGYLSFFAYVSSEGGYDYLEFYVDSVRQLRISGTAVTSWMPCVAYLTAGSHILRWVYIKDGGISSGSDTAYIDALTYVPETPTTLEAAPSSATTVDLTWVDNAAGGGTYKIERKNTGSFIQVATAAAGATSYSDTGLTTDTTYTYRVRASNSSGDSPYSNEASATPSYPPLAPNGLSAAAASATQINLSWTDNSDNETTFNVERKIGGGVYAEIGTVAAGVTTYNDYGLTTGTTYYYRVRAHNAVGYSTSYSNEAYATAAAPAAGGGGGGGGCFIATAAFGSPLESHVQILRDFRDRVLLSSSAGKAFVDFYYKTSPAISDKIAPSEGLRLITRLLLMPVIGVAYLIMHLGMLMTLLLFTIFALTIIFTIRTLSKKMRKSARAEAAA